MLVNVHDLQYNFEDVKADTINSFDIHRGEFFGFLGPNDAVKTTTVRLLTGQTEPNWGQANLSGRDGIKDRDRRKRMIGIVFYDQPQYERLSAYNNLCFNYWIYNLPLSLIDEVLQLIHQDERSGVPAPMLSGRM